MKPCRSLSEIGKTKRINKLFNENGKTLIIPLDDNLISGPQTKIERMDIKSKQIIDANPTAILAYQGTLKTINEHIPTILNVTASTINSNHTNKVIISSIENAIKLCADAVAVHINLSSIYESRMLEIFGEISSKCDSFGIPLMAIIYPRSEILNSDGKYSDFNYDDYRINNQQKYADLVSHCVRVGYEIGADIIKTHFTGSISSFKQVIDSAVGVPVLISGGNETNVRDLFIMTEQAIKAGASGACIGRNVFCRKDSGRMIRTLKKIIFENISAQEAYNLYLIEKEGDYGNLE